MDVPLDVKRWLIQHSELPLWLRSRCVERDGTTLETDSGLTLAALTVEPDAFNSAPSEA
jgi:hypothetical protein